MDKISSLDKLQLLRKQMQYQHIDAFIAMSADPHLSEYLPEHWKIRAWLTGFTGSVGTIVVTQNFAGLWVDGRYWIQAEQQLLHTGFDLQKQTQEESSTHLYWLTKNLPAHARISINAHAISVQHYDVLQHLASKNHFELVTHLDLIAEIWENRPTLPQQAIYEVKQNINHLSRVDKIKKIRQQLN